MSRRRPARGRTRVELPADPNQVAPATREQTLPAGLVALAVGFAALAISARTGSMLLYGDAVAHLGIARGIVDTRAPGLGNLGGVWLPLPHLLMLPFIGRMEWWQNGMAGAWPSLACFVLAVMGLYRLARRLLPPAWALVATAFFGLNANLLYLSTTAMTEPLFLALLVWIVLLTLELTDAVRAGEARFAGGRLVLLGMLNFAAVMTRYDGWVLSAAVWGLAMWQLARKPELRRGIVPQLVTFTFLTVAGPLLWFGYNHVYGHDWLDFLRGPYSAREIWHNPAWSLMLYARTAQVDAAWWETGWLLAAAALWGTWRAIRERMNGTALLLWLPLPFYVYSISYGSVPIFIPQLYPHSYYNSRYGVEMLPVLAVFLAYALWSLARRFGSTQPLLMRLGPPLCLLLIVVNTLLMLHATPLVLKEAMVNSRGRLALEEPLARELQALPRSATILMENSSHVGALQTAGIELKQTIGPGDYYGWRAGLAHPAATADFVVTLADDDLYQAVQKHPENLTELSIICATGQPCARVYQSDLPPDQRGAR